MFPREAHFKEYFLSVAMRGNDTAWFVKYPEVEVSDLRMWAETTSS